MGGNTPTTRLQDAAEALDPTIPNSALPWNQEQWHLAFPGYTVPAATPVTAPAEPVTPPEAFLRMAGQPTMQSHAPAAGAIRAGALHALQSHVPASGAIQFPVALRRSFHPETPEAFLRRPYPL